MNKGQKVRVEFGKDYLIGILTDRFDDFRGKGWKVVIKNRGFMYVLDEDLIKWNE